MTRAVAAAVLVFSTSPALAWESQCRPDGVGGGRFSNYSASICDADMDDCVEGLGFARGQQLGEHSFITRRALSMAGLLDLASDATLLDYWIGGGLVPGTGAAGAGGARSLEPEGPGGMTERSRRPFTLPEIAQIPDGSHSFADFLLGNEHCFVPNLPAGTPEEIAACHSFFPHMGSVNSTHFAPQVDEMYRQYHAIGRAIAERCAQMRDAFDLAPDHTLAARGDDAVRACETEALAFETIASHYMADAWSSGHMWERWGSPLAESTAMGRLRALAVAAMSGLIHGWRSLTRGFPFNLEHDQMCMPGPFDADDEEEPIVDWVSRGGGRHAGGGDLYLLQCNAFEGNREWAVSTGRALDPQFDRMETCLARGFEDVYGAGPQTRGALSRIGAADFDRAVTSAADPDCFDARVTNEAIRLGLRLSEEFDLADPGVGTRILIRILEGVTGLLDTFGITPPEIDGLAGMLRRELGALGLRVTQAAHARAEGTDLASGGLGVLLFNQPNHVGRPLIAEERVPYLERRDPDLWSARPVSDDACSTDADCPLVDGHVTYCARAVAVGDAIGRRCLPQEAAILRAFREAELPYWCEANDGDAIGAARERCKVQGGLACDACVEVLLPHLRNACDRGSWEPFGRDDDRRSMCDVLAEDGLVSGEPYAVYRPYDNGDVADAERAARELCQLGRQSPLEEYPAWYDFREEPPEGITPHWAGGWLENHATCGAGIGEHWWHFVHEPAGWDHEDVLTFTLMMFDDFPYFTPADRLELAVMEDCDEARTTIVPASDTNGNGTPETIEWRRPIVEGGTWEICMRLRTLDEKVQTGFSFWGPGG